MWMQMITYGYLINPTTLSTYVFRDGAIAQPFTPLIGGIPLASIILRLGKRADRDTTGRFLTMQIVSGFNTPGQTTLLGQGIPAESLPGILYDPATLQLISPTTLGTATIILDTPITLAAGTPYAIILSDDDYYNQKRELGLDAMCFVTQIGTPGTPGGTTHIRTRTY